LADHVASGAGGALIRHDQNVPTVEFKINPLRPALGNRLHCRATVLRAGKTIIVAESEGFAGGDGDEKLAAKATVTLAVVQQRKQA
jgi:uncharacterized protein (TIGR00369 family)